MDEGQAQLVSLLLPCVCPYKWSCTHCCHCLGLHCGVQGLVAAVKKVQLWVVQIGEVDSIPFSITLSQVVAPTHTQAQYTMWVHICVGLGRVYLTHMAGPRFEENSQ